MSSVILIVFTTEISHRSEKRVKWQFSKVPANLASEFVRMLMQSRVNKRAVLLFAECATFVTRGNWLRVTPVGGDTSAI